MRVLISAETFLPAVNGVSGSVLRVLEHLDRRGHVARVVAPGPGDGHVTLASGSRVTVERVRSLEVPGYRTVRVGVAARTRIDQVVRDFRPDLVHLAAPVVLGHQVGLVARELRIPAVAVFQTDLPGFVSDYHLRAAAGPLWGWLRSIHNRAPLTLAPTRTTAVRLRHLGFDRVRVWGRGVDHDQFDPARRSDSFRTGCGAGPSQVLVGYVGRLAAEKRVDRLRRLAGDDALRLVVVGDGPERASLERLLPEARFTGFLSGGDLGEAVASLDVMVHTGEHETFCQTVQEAMASGVPVVAPAAGGPLDLVDPGVSGLLYRPGDELALTSCVRRLAADAELRRAMGRNGRARVASRSWEAVGDELLDSYGLVLDARATAA